MMVKYERPYSYAAHWAKRFGILSCLIFIAILLLHRFGPLTTPHFLTLAIMTVGLAALAVLLAGIGLVRLWTVAAKGGMASLAALIFSTVPLSAAGLAAAGYFTRPALHDVTTDPADPPPWIAEPAEVPGWLGRQTEISRQDRDVQAAAYPGLTGRRYDGALDRVLQGARTVAEKTGVKITEQRGLENAVTDLEDMVINPETAEPEDAEPQNVPVPLDRPLESAAVPPVARSNEILLQGEWRTLVTGFRFDVLIRLREEAETTLVDVRAQSRYGAHDLGGGALFAETYLRALDAELLGIAGD